MIEGPLFDRDRQNSCILLPVQVEQPDPSQGAKSNPATSIKIRHLRPKAMKAKTSEKPSNQKMPNVLLLSNPKHNIGYAKKQNNQASRRLLLESTHHGTQSQGNISNRSRNGLWPHTHYKKSKPILLPKAHQIRDPNLNQKGAPSLHLEQRKPEPSNLPKGSCRATSYKCAVSPLN